MDSSTQAFGLLPLLSALENVELPLHIAGIGRGERRLRALETLAMVGLDSRVSHRPFELSGGEQQRVAVARAVVTHPTVIFADEPTGELDSITAESIGAMLRSLCSEQNITMVVTTHDIALTSRADRSLAGWRTLRVTP
jgi:predicted ABC-type transport system involved in lysophospholipase L1 biosynthesis ATPase subunit